MDANLGSLLLQLNSLGILAHDGKPPDFKNFGAEVHGISTVFPDRQKITRCDIWLSQGESMVSMCSDKKTKRMLGNSKTHSPARFEFPLAWSEAFESDSVLISANVVAI